MKTVIPCIFCCCILLFIGTIGYTQPLESFNDAKQALQNLQIDKGRAILQSLSENDTGDTQIDVEVMGTLAWLDWHIYRDFTSSEAHLDRLATYRQGLYLNHKIRALIQIDRQVYESAIKHAEVAIEYAENAADNHQAVIIHAKAVYEHIRDRLLHEAFWIVEPARKATDYLNAALETAPSDIEAARLLLGLSLIMGDGQQALSAWKAYYGIVEATDQWTEIQQPLHILEQYLPTIGETTITIETYQNLVWALSDSRFYEFAHLLILLAPSSMRKALLENPAVSNVEHYARYLRFMQDEVEQLYRYTAQNMGSHSTIRKKIRAHEVRVESQQRELLRLLGHDVPETHNAQFNRYFETEMRHRFGAFGFTGSMNSYDGYSRVLGHIIREESMHIEQYGYGSTIHFIELDHMNTVGFPGWLHSVLDVGGWSAGETIIGVRQAYADQPSQGYSYVVDPQQRAMVLSYASNLLASNRFEQILQGISIQLSIRVVDAIYDHWHAQGFRGSDLYHKFARTYMDYVQQSAIFAHEGRHGIDQIYFPQEFHKWSSETRELYAKYSELVFAPDPRIPLASMLYDLSDSDHGRANRQIVTTLESYITKNADSIAGYDPSKQPFLSLLYLSDEQIRECIMQVDPLYQLSGSI
jgi:hypothetical protein